MKRVSASGGYFKRGGLPSAYGVVKTYDERTDEIFIDVDEKTCPHLRSLWVTSRILGLRPIFIRFDRTRRGWHIVIRLERRKGKNGGFTPLEKVALQAVFGSDVRRESLNLMRVLHGNGKDKRWNILYSRKLK
jgi:hypothetical protein